jgi:hypothetical protein
MASSRNSCCKARGRSAECQSCPSSPPFAIVYEVNTVQKSSNLRSVEHRLRTAERDRARHVWKLVDSPSLMFLLPSKFASATWTMIRGLRGMKIRIAPGCACVPTLSPQWYVQTSPRRIHARHLGRFSSHCYSKLELRKLSWTWRCSARTTLICLYLHLLQPCRDFRCQSRCRITAGRNSISNDARGDRGPDFAVELCLRWQSKDSVRIYVPDHLLGCMDGKRSTLAS